MYQRLLHTKTPNVTLRNILGRETVGQSKKKILDTHFQDFACTEPKRLVVQIQPTSCCADIHEPFPGV